MKKPLRFCRVRYYLVAVVLICSVVVMHMAFGVGVCHTKNKPKESDLVGIYRPNLKTRFLIERQTKSPATNCAIKISGDGNIEFVNMTRWVTGPIPSDRSSIEATNGLWKLDQLEGAWCLTESQKITNGDMLGYLSLVGERPPYSIQINNWRTGVPFYFVQEKP